MGIEHFDSQEDLDDAFEDEMQRLQDIEDIRFSIQEAENEIEHQKMWLDEYKRELAKLLGDD